MLFTICKAGLHVLAINVGHVQDTIYNYILPSRHIIMYPILDIVISGHIALSIYGS